MKRLTPASMSMYAMLWRGAESLILRTVDGNVVVILVGKHHDLLAYNQCAKVCMGGVWHGMPLFIY